MTAIIQNQRLHSRRNFIRTSAIAVGAVGILPSCATLEKISQSLEPTLQEERQLGEQAWQQIKRQRRFINGTNNNKMLDTVASSIVGKTNQQHLNWEFAVIEDATMNAFALPGGKIAVHSGLFKTVDNEEELATVVGHEVAHVTARHSAKRIGQSRLANIGMTVAELGLSLGEVKRAGQIMSLLGAGVTYGVILPYSREQEYEADYRGVGYMAKAGYDPRRSISFWNEMRASAKQKNIAEYASTHPSDVNRINALNRIMPEMVSLYKIA